MKAKALGAALVAPKASARCNEIRMHMIPRVEGSADGEYGSGN